MKYHMSEINWFERAPNWSYIWVTKAKTLKNRPKIHFIMEFSIIMDYWTGTGTLVNEVSHVRGELV